jgi:hypothetical protein
LQNQDEPPARGAPVPGSPGFGPDAQLYREIDLDREFSRARVVSWPLIRAEYEQTEIPLRQLAAKWGFRSHGTLSRRIKEEGWQRNVAAIAASMATAEVLDNAGADEGAQHERPPAPERAPDPGKRRLGFGNPEGPVDPHLLVNAPSSRERRAIPVSFDLDPEDDPDEQLSQAKRIGRLHALQVRAELAGGARMISLATRISYLIEIIMWSEDPAEIRDAKNRLTAISAEGGEGLPSLLRAATSTFIEGVKLRRASLSMPAVALPRGGGLRDKPIGADDIPDHVKRMMGKLDTDTLRSLRDAAAAMKQSEDEDRHAKGAEEETG